MRVSLAWLREFVPIEIEPAELARRLTLAGLAVEGVAGHGDELVYDIEIASNRPDCLSHEGIAREVAAITERSWQPPARWSGAPRESGPAAAEAIRISNLAPQACGRYCARVLEKIHAGDAPTEIATRLRLLGQRPINAMADLSNYVLLEMGQPTHAFDLDTLRGGEIRVRFARAGEMLVTLDEVERRLDPADLVIADAERPVALAGIMGGAATAITGATRRVLIESAWFDPLTVRRSAKRHGLHTEASHRFERGADPAAAPRAAHRIAVAAQELGASVRPGLLEAAGELPHPPRLELRAAQVLRLLGVEIGPDEARAILQRLGFAVETGTVASIGLFTVPSWRPDIAREVDLIEEIARIRGYETIPPRLPPVEIPTTPRPERALRHQVRRQLLGRGYTEAVTLSFAAEAECRPFAPGSEPVPVRNPLSEEAAILRTSPLPAMLHLLRNNLNRGVANARLFEMGKRYELRRQGPVEIPMLALGAVGLAGPPHWRQSGDPPARPFDFFDLKGDLEALFDLFNVPGLEFAALKPAGTFHPGRAGVARLEDVEVARFGQLHPEMAELWKMPAATWLARIDLPALFEAGERPVRYRQPSRFPASERDFSFLFPEAVESGAGVDWQTIAVALAAPPISHLEEVTPVEVYRGSNIAAGQYSLLLRARFQSNERTLREEEVQSAADQIISRLQRLGGTQR